MSTIAEEEKNPLLYWCLIKGFVKIFKMVARDSLDLEPRDKEASAELLIIINVEACCIMMCTFVDSKQ